MRKQEPYTEQGEGIIQRDALLERVGGDMDLLRELVDLFMDDSLQLVDRIRQAVTSKDADELEKAAHGLKGSVLNFECKASELVDLFMDDSVNLVDRISKAVTNKDADELEKAAHGLKGSCTQF